MTDDPREALRQQIIAASPSVWQQVSTAMFDGVSAVTIHWDGDNACPNNATVTTSSNNMELTTTTTSGTTSEWTSVGEVMGEVIRWIGENDDHITQVWTEAFQRRMNDPEMLMPPMDPQDGFETSSPLRAEDDQDDTMGAESDFNSEMGEAEAWFRDKMRVRP
jgi:hypothetical protein